MSSILGEIGLEQLKKKIKKKGRGKKGKEREKPMGRYGTKVKTSCVSTITVFTVLTDSSSVARYRVYTGAALYGKLNLVALT